MTNFVDFTVEGRHTKFSDCYIISGTSTFITSRNILCRIDYFNKIFDGSFKTNKKDNKPYCTLDIKYENIINIFLNYLYYKKYTSTDNNVELLIELCDYIGYSDMIPIIFKNITDITSYEYVILIDRLYNIIGPGHLKYIDYYKLSYSKYTINKDVLIYIRKMDDISFLKNYLIAHYCKYLNSIYSNNSDIITKFISTLYK